MRWQADKHQLLAPLLVRQLADLIHVLHGALGSLVLYHRLPKVFLYSTGALLGPLLQSPVNRRHSLVSPLPSTVLGTTPFPSTHCVLQRTVEMVGVDRVSSQHTEAILERKYQLHPPCDMDLNPVGLNICLHWKDPTF